MLEATNLTKVYYSGFFKRTSIEAVNNISFKVREGEIVSLVGESGSGKTTLAKIILRILPPTSESSKVFFEGKDVWRLKTLKELKWYWRNVHAIFQDPFATFNPIYRVVRALQQAFNLWEDLDGDRNRIVIEALKQVGLNPADVLGKYPHELSGGQRQRIMVARCLMIRPKLVIADEPISMVDASTRAGILKLFMEMRDQYKTSLIFITHDFGLACYVSDRILVMYKGKIIEEGLPDEVMESPKHSYTRNLIKSVPLLLRKWPDI